MTIKEKKEQIDEIGKAVKTCLKCLYGHHLNYDSRFTAMDKTLDPHIFVRGYAGARIVILLQNPGIEEIRKGLPAVGTAGQILNRTLLEAGIDTKFDTLITNCMNCFTPKDGKEKKWTKNYQKEINTCKPYWKAVVDIIHPQILVLAGQPSLYAVYGIKTGILKSAGQIFPKVKGINAEQVFILPHPSWAGYGGEYQMGQYVKYCKVLRTYIDWKLYGESQKKREKELNDSGSVEQMNMDELMKERV